MNRRPVIFLSSTYFDLKKARSIAIRQLVKNQYLFSGMESFFVMPMMEQWENIKRTINECDIYVVVLGERFGCVAHEGKSCTELECEYAEEIGKPIIALVQEKKNKFSIRHHQSLAERKKQDDFKERIKCDYKYSWQTYDELITNMFKGIYEIEKSTHIVGYGRPFKREIDFKETPKGFRLRLEYSKNTTAWDKKLMVHEEIYFYDEQALLKQILEIMERDRLNPENALYCFLKSQVIAKFKDEDIIVNGFFVNNHDLQNALILMKLENLQ